LVFSVFCFLAIFHSFLFLFFAFLSFHAHLFSFF
jgi:hypothetical protein